ncbi:MAG: hypothetical protein ACLFTP_06465 [Rhodosalinus sp.]
MAGLAGMGGSLCRFLACTSETAALVKAVGQAELPMSRAVTWRTSASLSAGRTRPASGCSSLPCWRWCSSPVGDRHHSGIGFP